MEHCFSGKVCLITGAASGIGRATAARLSSLGAAVALQDIDAHRLEETAKLCTSGTATSSRAFDVGSSGACDEFATATKRHFGRLDYVFNCAGVNPTAYALTDTTDEYYDKLMNTNLRGTYNITRAVIPHMQAGGSIVNTSSIMGLTASANMAIYCASKFAIVGFTKAMAMELGPKQIRVNAIAPGYIDTPTNASVVAGPDEVAATEKKIAMGRFGTPEEVADVVAFLFSDESRYMSGSIVEITGGR
ncbi:hypothetical protein BAUCODRAFT_80227 [Baudoinia panamericana UAMH 10762]|uniref:Ketoreductase domain-containing protein n=1 Tax=Baudoinia panamericana (strain UAMH 10762) TaxID=717646 RepID=M2MIF9_BAUPA|nr:uncharacterized protein BAUCODRAFT_80227 [Baudoinia panamericana UAMH 10762]EMC91053.1 hypothetical protein BAUCODRAFT_80227 [Baudoinia panamericana UAMH 10762]